MKKRIFASIALTLACMFGFSGCSCTGTPLLQFKNSFIGTSDTVDPPSGYTEVLTYSVKHVDEFGSHFGTGNGLDKETYEFSNGVYVSTLKTLTSLPETINSDIPNSLPSDAKTIYHLNTKFSISVKYTNCAEYLNCENSDGVYNDFIETDIYFCSYKRAYAPIYTKTVSDYSFLVLTSSGNIIRRLKAERETLYNTTTYTMYENINNLTDSHTYEYTFMSLIDNAELLFTLRNLDLEEEGRTLIPTVSYTYGDAQNLLIYNNGDSVELAEVNGIKEDISLAQYSFVKSNTTSAGTEHLVYIQKKTEEQKQLAYNSLLYKYVSPLTTYGNILPMGALVYTLTNVSIS